jgi:predicted DNA-binding protein (UPF0251 family)
LEEVVVTVDEFEAVRLVDLEGLYHERAAECMGVSRRTLGRMVISARRKVAYALAEGCALRIEGGKFQLARSRSFTCQACQWSWRLPFGSGRPETCPRCRSEDVFRSDRRSAGRSTVHGAIDTAAAKRGGE